MTAFRPLDVNAIRQEALAARERQARALFDIPTVSQHISKAAVAGLGRLRLRQEQPIRLADTAPASRLVTWLARSRFNYRWYETARRIGPDELASYCELIIEWDTHMDVIVKALRDVSRQVEQQSGSDAGG